MLGVTAGESAVHGEVAPGLEEGEQGFRRNFAQRQELGAARDLPQR